MSMIEDGKGKGFLAEVDSENKLKVKATSIPEVSFRSINDQSCFQLHFQKTISVGNTLENIGFMKYNGDKKLKVDSILCTREDVNLTSGSQAVVEVLLKVDYTSGGSVITPNNMNISSARSLSADAYSANAGTIVLDTANESELMDFVVDGEVVYNFSGALILSKNDTLSFVAKSKNVNDVVHIVIFVYETEE